MCFNPIFSYMLFTVFFFSSLNIDAQSPPFHHILIWGGGQPFGPVGHGDQEPTTRDTKPGKGGTNKNKKQTNKRGACYFNFTSPHLSFTTQTSCFNCWEKGTVSTESVYADVCICVSSDRVRHSTGVWKRSANLLLVSLRGPALVPSSQNRFSSKIAIRSLWKLMSMVSAICGGTRGREAAWKIDSKKKLIK